LSLSKQVWTRLRRKLGIDISSEKYSYAYDPRFGKVSASRVADTPTQEVARSNDADEQRESRVSAAPL